MKRWLFRILIFLIIVVMVHIGKYCVAMNECVYALSPLLFLANCVTGFVTALGAFSLVTGTFMMFLCVWQRRFFCQWACPLGFLQDVLRFARSCVTRKRILNSPIQNKLKAFRAVGVILALVTLMALAWGGVTFLFLDPIVILHGSHTLNWCRYTLLGMGVLVLLFPQFWCFFICPCGGIQEVLWRLRQLLTRTNRKVSDQTVQNPLRRKLFFKTLSVLAVGVCYISSRAMKTAQIRVSSLFIPFRPPGAIPEADFLSHCTRCGACSGVCPTGLIKIVTDKSQPLIYGTPTLNFTPENAEELVYCDAECNECTKVCPTGALKKLQLDQKKELRLALCHFDYERCRRYYRKECSICLQNCPFGAIEEVWSEEIYSKIPRINADLCTGCGRCVAFCPGEPLLGWEIGGNNQFTTSEENGSDTNCETTGVKALTLHPVL